MVGGASKTASKSI